MKYPKVNIVKEDGRENIPLSRIVKPRYDCLLMRVGESNLAYLSYFLDPEYDHKIVEDSLGVPVVLSTFKQD